MEKFVDPGFRHGFSDTGHYHPVAFSREQIAEAQQRELIEEGEGCAPVPPGMIEDNNTYVPNGGTWPLVLIEAWGN